MNMNKEEAKQKLKKFMRDQVFTFTIESYPEGRWVAQCNEVDGIMTCGTGYDQGEMEALIQDAILSAAGIPKEFSSGIIKRVWSNDLSVIPAPSSEIKSNVNITLFQSTYAS